ncbi:hypothetical protein Lal_00041124 [Lupinus albus]|nr:hypothetical protein Lal_00041124 [Lupinus albus]
MEGNWAEGKRILEYDEEEEEEEEEEVISEIMSNGEEGRNKKRAVTTDLYSSKRGSKARGSVPPSCQVDSCKTDLSDAKQYHRRHKVCEYHAKAPFVLIADHQQRFCQQCSMRCQNLMSQKEVVEGVWLDIMRGVAKMQLIITENDFIAETQQK